MAPVKVMRARTVFFSVVLIIFSCEVLMSCQGVRTFVKNENNVVEDHHLHQIRTFVVLDRRSVLDDNDNNQDQINVSEAVKNTDDIRPTAPGHSPGAGHNHGPSADPNSK